MGANQGPDEDYANASANDGVTGGPAEAKDLTANLSDTETADAARNAIAAVATITGAKGSRITTLLPPESLIPHDLGSPRKSKLFSIEYSVCRRMSTRRRRLRYRIRGACASRRHGLVAGLR